MITPTPALVTEIAGELEVGYRVFMHKSTGELRSFVDPDTYEDLEKEFADEFKVFLKKEAKKYVEVERWSTPDAFRIMEAFAEQLTDAPDLQKQLFHALDNRKPFSGFKWKVDNSGPYREQWFAFKTAQQEQYVKKQLELLLDIED